MLEIEWLFLVLGVAAFLAGFVDSIVGGGGLIQIPALFSAFPHTAPATLFGTNKIASIVGTSTAALQYARRIRIPWGLALPGALAALMGAWYGAKAVVYLPGDFLRPLVLILLVLVALYTFFKKDFGATEGRGAGKGDLFRVLSIGALIGFYDGFFGPGTGSFLIFLFIRFVGMDFLRASATAKILNVATNFAALSFFATSVELFWKLGLCMAFCNLLGAVLGSRMALKRGTGFVRQVFLLVVSLLIAKMTYDLFR